MTAWFCSRWEQPEARTRQKTARNNAFEQRTGLIGVGGKFTSQPTATCGSDAGQSILASRFEEAGISSLYLFLRALVPTLIAGAALMLLP